MTRREKVMGTKGVLTLTTRLYAAGKKPGTWRFSRSYSYVVGKNRRVSMSDMAFAAFEAIATDLFGFDESAAEMRAETERLIAMLKAVTYGDSPSAEAATVSVVSDVVN